LGQWLIYLPGEFSLVVCAVNAIKALMVPTQHSLRQNKPCSPTTPAQLQKIPANIIHAHCHRAFRDTPLLTKFCEKRVQYLVEKGASLEKLSEDYMEGLQELAQYWDTDLSTIARQMGRTAGQPNNAWLETELAKLESVMQFVSYSQSSRHAQELGKETDTTTSGTHGYLAQEIIFF